MKHVMLGTMAATLSSMAVAQEKPNVVIIYGDDVGYGDVGVYGSKLIPTPNIDKLAASGLVFTDGHCTAATCSPSRFSLLTGIHGFRHRISILPPDAPLSIPLDKMTLPKVFKKAGYQTAVIGKWHLGLGERKKRTDWNNEVKPGPLEIGFDYSFLLPSTNDRVPCVYLENHRVVNLDPNDPLYVGSLPKGATTSTVYPDGRKDRSAMTYYQSSHGHDNSIINGIGRIGYMWGGKSALWNDETMSDEFVKQAKTYITNRKKDKPFFLFFSSQDIHVPRAPHPRFHGKTTLGYRGDAMVQFDWSTGELIKTLEKHGLRDNTIVIISSDNGPVYDDGYRDGCTVRTSSKEVDRGHDASGPYRGGKYQVYEGGTRVPFIVSWPKKIKPGKTDAMFSQIDLMASFAKLVGVTLEEGDGIDSRDMLPALLGKDKAGLPYMVEETRLQALRMGDWKFIDKKKHSQLYNLKTDIEERQNVIKKHPEVVKKMKAMLTKIRNAKKGIRSL